MQRSQRVANRIALDHATFLHDGLTGPQTALAILEVDERQDTRVLRSSGIEIPCGVMLEDGLDQIGKQRAAHRACRACIQVCHQRDGFLSVERSLDGIAAGFDKCAQLRSRHRAFDLSNS